MEGPILGGGTSFISHAGNNRALQSARLIFVFLLIPTSLLLVCRMLSRLNSNVFLVCNLESPYFHMQAIVEV